MRSFFITFRTSLGRCATGLLCAAIAIQVYGCTRVSTSGGSPNGGNRSTVHGVVRVAIKAEPNTLDPVTSGLVQETYVETAIFDGLLQYDSREQLVPDLAMVVPTQQNGGISKDGKTIVFHLRHGVRWQDGQPFTSADVAFTYELYINPKTNGFYRQTYRRITRIDTPDQYTAVLHLTEPYAPALYRFFLRGGGGYVVPRHVLERSADVNTDRFNQSPLGTGPFRLVRWDHGAQILLEANPEYFAGAPRIKAIHLMIVADPNTALSQLASHEMDVVTDLTPSQYTSIKQMNGLRSFLVPTYYERFLTYNARRAPFDDPRVRRALALALDRRHIGDTAYAGTAVLADSLIPPYSWAYTNDNAAPHYDPQAAKALLQAAGWTMGADHAWHKNGRTLSFSLLNQPESHALTTMAVEIQRAWQQLGIDVAIQQVARNVIYGSPGLAYSGRFDVLLDDWSADTDPDRTHITAAAEIAPRGFNNSFFADPEVDRLSELAMLTYDQTRRAALYTQIQRRLNQDLPYVPLVWEQRIYAVNTDLRGFAPEPIYSDFWNVQDWQI